MGVKFYMFVYLLEIVALFIYQVARHFGSDSDTGSIIPKQRLIIK